MICLVQFQSIYALDESCCTLIWLGLILILPFKWDVEGECDNSIEGASMKSALSFSGGLFVGAVIFGIGGVFFGYIFSHFGEPLVIVRNLTHSPISQVRIENGVGELYTLENIPPGESRRTKISGRDKALWVVVISPTGERKKSEQIYVSSQGKIFVAVSGEAITIDYEL